MKNKRLTEMAEDPGSQTIFEQLVQDEMNHEKLLRSRYAAFSGVVLYRVLRQFRQMKIELKIE